MNKKHHTLGCCGLDCGLCPRFYTDGASRCPGCCGEVFSPNTPCPFVTCCFKRKAWKYALSVMNIPVPGPKRKPARKIRSLPIEKCCITWQLFANPAWNRFCSSRPGASLSENMLQQYDDGRSKSYYCIAAALLSIAGLAQSIQKG